MKIVVASENQGKIKEISAFFKDFPITLVPQTEYNVPSVEETGLSFVENAILKARHASTHTGMPSMGDDSGLVVDFLEGAPGIYSARYAGLKASWEDNIKKLLSNLKEVPTENRNAYFYCAIAFVQNAKDPIPLIFQAKWEGEILTEPKGSNGFGYDPIFYVAEHKCTAAEISPDLKNKISHRAKALKDFAEAIKSQV